LGLVPVGLAHMRFQGSYNQRRVRFEDDGRFAQGGVLGQLGRGELGSLGRGEELVAVVVNGVLRIFEGMPGENEDNALLGSDFIQGDEFFEAGEGDGGGGFAAYALGADLGLGKGDLLLGDLLTPAAEIVDDCSCLAPGSRVADADGGGSGVCGDGLHDAVAVDEPAVKRVSALCLNDADLGKARNEAELVHLHKTFAQCGRVGEVSAGDDDMFRDLPVHLLDHLEGGGLLAFEPVGIDRVQEIDGELLHQFAENFDANRRSRS